MAGFDFSIDNEFLAELSMLGDVDKYALKMLDEAAPILVESLKKEISKHDRTGNLSKSIKAAKAKRAKNGVYYVSIRPTGSAKTHMDDKGVVRERKIPVRNMEILVYLEHGKKNQAPRPVLTKSFNDSEDDVYKKMQEVFNQEVSK